MTVHAVEKTQRGTYSVHAYWCISVQIVKRSVIYLHFSSISLRHVVPAAVLFLIFTSSSPVAFSCQTYKFKEHIPVFQAQCGSFSAAQGIPCFLWIDR
jgi:hypothetical protein